MLKMLTFEISLLTRQLCMVKKILRQLFARILHQYGMLQRKIINVQNVFRIVKFQIQFFYDISEKFQQTLSVRKPKMFFAHIPITYHITWQYYSYHKDCEVKS
eukprot:TRINITY_DN22284_c0_g1_i8.p5 TRINITY_DN22284_c0_g1~~TRINITY_DN22284_c0_g1_i8.p5  ORF type:complete len:103 (+),score=0.52 TRINITY_DN22284_c0_g1_i8:780-1088(+)